MTAHGDEAASKHGGSSKDFSAHGDEAAIREALIAYAPNMTGEEFAKAALPVLVEADNEIARLSAALAERDEALSAARAERERAEQERDAACRREHELDREAEATERREEALRAALRSIAALRASGYESVNSSLFGQCRNIAREALRVDDGEEE